MQNAATGSLVASEPNLSVTSALHVLIAALITALATSLGALPFLFSRDSRRRKQSSGNDEQESLTTNNVGPRGNHGEAENVENIEDDEDEDASPYWLRHAHSLTAGMMLGCAIILISEAFQIEHITPDARANSSEANHWVTSDKGYVLMGISFGIILVVISQAIVGDAEEDKEEFKERMHGKTSHNSTEDLPQDNQVQESLLGTKSTTTQNEMMMSDSEDDSAQSIQFFKGNPKSSDISVSHEPSNVRSPGEDALSRALLNTDAVDTQKGNTMNDEQKDTNVNSDDSEATSTTEGTQKNKDDTQKPRLTSAARKALLVMFVMFAHSFAEGVSLGVSWAKTPALGSFVSLSLAAHNIPEGLAVSLTVIRAGGSVGKAALWSFISSVPQPIAALPAYFCVQKFAPLLPIGLGFAAGAMLWLPISELIPEALSDRRATRLQVASVTATASLLTICFGLDWERLKSVIV